MAITSYSNVILLLAFIFPIFHVNTCSPLLLVSILTPLDSKSLIEDSVNSNVLGIISVTTAFLPITFWIDSVILWNFLFNSSAFNDNVFSYTWSLVFSSGLIVWSLFAASLSLPNVIV